MKLCEKCKKLTACPCEGAPCFLASKAGRVRSLAPKRRQRFAAIDERYNYEAMRERRKARVVYT